VPELPEVETIRAGLDAILPGQTVIEARVLHERSVRRQSGGAEAFVVGLAGRTFAGARRRGKYLWFPFADGDALVAHLGMSGQFLMSGERTPHTRVELALTGGVLRFADQRTFGGLWLCPGGADGPADIAHIAPDVFEADLRVLAHHIHRQHRGIKRVLLDQGVVSGIGNIYADEALWRAGTYYAADADRLPVARIVAVLEAARNVMAESLNQGGTSFDALYVHVDGEAGYFERSLAVYGREGQPCLRCGRPIVREPFMNRSSFRCPQCQRHSFTGPGEGNRPDADSVGAL